MNQSSQTHIGEAEIKRYLYNEMSDEERAALEEKFFDDDRLFVEVADTENHLVDFYARGRLSGEELKRFERALNQSPERRRKIANALALQSLIDEERTPEKFADTKETFWERAAKIFSFQTPALGFAMGGLLFLFLLASALLFLDNRRKSDELAGLQNVRNTAPSRRENELENQLKDAQAREANLQNQIDSEREASGDLTDELEREKTRRGQIQIDLERLRKTRETNAAPNVAPTEQSPVIASIFLKPATRDATISSPKIFSVERATKRLAVRLSLAEETMEGERVSIRLNGKVVAQNLAARASAGGQKYVQLTVAVADLTNGANQFTVLDRTGKEIGKYIFTMQKK